MVNHGDMKGILIGYCSITMMGIVENHYLDNGILMGY